MSDRSGAKATMRVLLLADVNSSHIIKWAVGLTKKNIEIGIFSFQKCSIASYKEYPSIQIFEGRLTSKISHKSFIQKMDCIMMISYLKKVIREFQPDILHAHYASSYGLIGALSAFHPYIISVWGSDVYDFPRISFLHRWILEYNLFKADCILSTSHAMAIETARYTNKQIKITPFGIDLKAFFKNRGGTLFSSEDIVIGTVKTLEEKYGVEYLIRAFAAVYIRHQDMPLKLLLVGGGSLEQKLKQLVCELGISANTIFTGKVPYVEVPKYHNMLSVSVSVSVSNSESFGVAVIEAGACGVPVVVSDAGGLPEVVEDGVTGIVVPIRNIKKTAEAIEKLVLDKNLREEMGAAGRMRVENLYRWDNNLQQMIMIYKEIISL